MGSPSATALARLRDPNHAALAELGHLLATTLADQPLTSLVPVASLVEVASRALSRVREDPDLRARLVARLELGRQHLTATPHSLGHFLPDEARAVTVAIAGLPWSPSKDLTLAVIRHDAVRGLLREVISGVIHGFVQRVRTTPVLGSAARAGKGLFGNMAASLGAAAEGLTSGLSKELESALASRADAFVDVAIEGAIDTIATWVADPRHADVSGALRASVAGVVLDRPLGTLVAEVDEVSTLDVVDALLGPLGASPSPERLQEAVSLLGNTTLGAWLDELDLRSDWQEGVTVALTPTLRALVNSEAFSAWWARLSS